MPKGQYDRSKAKSRKEPGANRQALINALAGYKKPRVDTKDPQAIAERIEEYLNYCMENDLAPGAAMCANWLGVDVHTLSDWYTGKYGTPEHQRIAARFYGIIQGVWEQDMHEGTINPVSGIFVGKAFYGYKDTQEIVVQHTTTEQLSISDLIAESKRLPGAETMSLPNSTPTIDADYTIIESNPGYEKAVARAERKRVASAERRAKYNLPEDASAEEYNKAYKKQQLKEYFQDHKQEYNERLRKYRAAKKAQKEAEANKETTD